MHKVTRDKIAEIDADIEARGWPTTGPTLAGYRAARLAGAARVERDPTTRQELIDEAIRITEPWERKPGAGRKKIMEYVNAA